MRIAPGAASDTGRVNFLIARAAGLGLGTATPNIFTTLGRHRRLFRRWLWFAGALMPGGRLPRADTELMILRTAHNCASDYEWRAHESLARNAGLTADQVRQVRAGPDAPGLSGRQRLLVRATDELHADRVLTDETWTELCGQLSDAELIELCMLVGHYEMLAMTLNSLGVQPDPPPPGRLPPTARLLQRLAGRGRTAHRRRAQPRSAR
ncbi:MAG: carboxymuconolactone decarboxylase family protein [Solirubrobacteraceae bacterium]